jgi:hypothetical protein
VGEAETPSGGDVAAAVPTELVDLLHRNRLAGLVDLELLLAVDNAPHHGAGYLGRRPGNQRRQGLLTRTSASGRRGVCGLRPA